MKKKKVMSKNGIVMIAIVILLLCIGVCYWVVLPYLKFFFKLDFSQDYRKVDGIEQIVFRKYYDETAYRRASVFLKKIDVEKQEEKEIVAPDWLENSGFFLFDISKSERMIAYHDHEQKAIILCDIDGNEIDSIKVEDAIEQIVFSPDNRYILYVEKDYGYYHKGNVTDDEYVYYRVYDIESKELITIYEGYRAFYKMEWQEANGV